MEGPDISSLIDKALNWNMMAPQYDQSVLAYSGLSLVSAFLPITLWNLVFRHNEATFKGGYKFAAYGAFYTWAPVAIQSVVHMFYQTKDVDFWLMNFAKLSTFGPWLFNFVALFMLMNSSVDVLSVPFVLFTIWVGTQASVQLLSHRELKAWKRRGNIFYVPPQGWDIDVIPKNFDDKSYLDDLYVPEPTKPYEPETIEDQMLL